MKLSLAALAVIVFASLVLFQNCGKGFKSGTIPADVNGSSGVNPPPSLPGPVIPGGTSFAKGDAFNYNSVSNKSQMVQTQVDSLGYANYTGVKAIAINAAGFGYVSRKGAGVQSDANTTALEGCVALGGGTPCALLAVGNVFEVSSAALPTSYTFTMTAPTTIVAASIPFVMPNLRASLAAQYNAATAPKALVLSVDGSFYWSSASDATPATSLADARRVAMERCELMAAVTPCTVFAENSTVLFNPASINRARFIDYAKTQVGTSVPGLKESYYNSYIVPYLAAVNGVTTHGVIYMGTDGSGGFAYNANAATAEAAALNFCNMNVNAGYVCYRYAIEKTVQNIAPNLFALKSFPAMHCKSVPRQTCADHKAMGCAAGMYYTMNGATPAIENCL